MAKVFAYASIFILGFTTISLWNFYAIIRPGQIKTLLAPADFKLAAEDVRLTADDGATLSGWFIPSGAEAAKGRAVILLHGYPAEKSDMLSVAAALHPGFSLLLMDLRSFGESGGAYTTLGVKERGDLQKAVSYLSERGFTDIGVFGFSLGGAIGIMTAAEDARVKAVAAYASFANLALLGESAYRNLFFLKRPMTALELLWARILFGESLMAASPEHAAERLSVPVFVIHSDEDEQIPFAHAKALEKALSQNKNARFYFIQGALHGELPEDFYGRLNNFFSEAF